MDKIKDVFLNSGESIKQALKKMDEAAKKILFIVDKQDRLLGTVTDGDIRRWILKGESLEAHIDKIMNKEPVVLKEGFDVEKAKEMMFLLEIECIPIVNEDRKVISAIRWQELFDRKFGRKQPIDNPVIIMAGGEGTRLSPFTHIFPKPLMPIGEKPIIELIIDKFIEFGCKDFYLSVNYKANILKAYFSELKHEYNISYIEEKKPLGTVGSLYMLRNTINKTFFVSNCDILIEADYSDILKFHKDSSNRITIVVSMKHYRIPYGICQIENGGILKEISEKPEYDFLVNTGMYIMEHEVLEDIPEDKVYNVTDLINDYIMQEKKIGVYPVSDKSWLDMGQLYELQDMVKNLNKNK